MRNGSEQFKLKIRVAAKLLRDARDLIEYASKDVPGEHNPDVLDLRDAAEDLGPILCTLESFGG